MRNKDNFNMKSWESLSISQFSTKWFADVAITAKEINISAQFCILQRTIMCFMRDVWYSALGCVSVKERERREIARSSRVN